jgi:hypothetical protein
MKVSNLYITILYIPGAFLACYGNNGAHQTTVLRWTGSANEHGIPRVYSNQYTPFALYLQSFTLSSNKQTKNVSKLFDLCMKMELIKIFIAD